MASNNNGVGVAVRKGAWTKEEDILLRDCIHKFGEGKWHLVPLRAGNIRLSIFQEKRKRYYLVNELFNLM